ncbi:hypothetical protein UFOVP116_246 [uncultured Caudovirales phage]|uniref:Uncharacterized protein n=1 Tax=uncultured Caudovirales phage TaxID=2100421 RepID=A0A6J5L9T0_9CAUD|nr:hypothetical protein UFOVP116_246 [uncultured Caudovirales phage]
MKVTAILGFVFLAIAIAIAAPLLVIWSLNTLFPVLAIPFALDTWVAAFLLNVLVFYRGGNRK